MLGPPLRNVLVGIDFSTEAERAAARAVRLPCAPGARIALVLVLPDGIGSFVGASLVASAERALNDVASELARSPRLRVESAVRRGNVAEELLRHAEDIDADLLVLGRKARRPVDEALLGATAEKVLRASERPVLVVGPGGPRAYTHPLVALDVSPTTARRALGVALRLLDPETEVVEVVHAVDAPDAGLLRGLGIAPAAIAGDRKRRGSVARFAVRETLEAVDIAPARFERVVRFGAPRAVILGQVQRSQPDLLVLGSHGRAGLSRLLHGSVAEAVLRRVRCDVLLAAEPTAPARGVAHAQGATKQRSKSSGPVAASAHR